jgi:hypothetical protein
MRTDAGPVIGYMGDRRSRSLDAAVRGLWQLGGVYLALGGLAAFYSIAYWGATLRAVTLAASALAPAAVCLLAASAAGRGRAWAMIVALVHTALGELVLLSLLWLAVSRIGVIDLAQGRSLAATAFVLLIILLIAVHARLIYYLGTSWGEGRLPQEDAEP